MRQEHRLKSPSNNSISLTRCTVAIPKHIKASLCIQYCGWAALDIIVLLSSETSDMTGKENAHGKGLTLVSPNLPANKARGVC